MKNGSKAGVGVTKDQYTDQLHPGHWWAQLHLYVPESSFPEEVTVFLPGPAPPSFSPPAALLMHLEINLE